MLVHHIHHISLYVRDLAISERFYTEVLQLRKIERPPFDLPGSWFDIGGGGQQLHLMLASDRPEMDDQATSHRKPGHFAIWIDSYPAAIDRLTQYQIPYTAKQESVAGFAQIYIRDPDQHIIELAAEQ